MRDDDRSLVNTNCYLLVVHTAHSGWNCQVMTQGS